MDRETTVILKDVRAGNACLIDVRTEKEWEAGHAKDALHFELSRLEKGELPDIDKSVPIYTYCGSGNRAGRAANILQTSGFHRALNGGGLGHWQEAESEV